MKTTIRENFSVRVFPKSLGNYGAFILPDPSGDNSAEYMQRCLEIEYEIKRHVDGVGGVEIEYDEREVCSYCGYDWDVDEETGEPFCCQGAIDEYKNKKP